MGSRPPPEDLLSSLVPLVGGLLAVPRVLGPGGAVVLLAAGGEDVLGLRVHAPRIGPSARPGQGLAALLAPGGLLVLLLEGLFELVALALVHGAGVPARPRAKRLRRGGPGRGRAAPGPAGRRR